MVGGFKFFAIYGIKKLPSIRVIPQFQFSDEKYMMNH